MIPFHLKTPCTFMRLNEYIVYNMCVQFNTSFFHFVYLWKYFSLSFVCKYHQLLLYLNEYRSSKYKCNNPNDFCINHSIDWDLSPFRDSMYFYKTLWIHNISCTTCVWNSTFLSCILFICKSISYCHLCAHITNCCCILLLVKH